MNNLIKTAFLIICSAAWSISANNEVNIHKLCKTDDSQCLQQIQPFLNKTQFQSEPWYKLKLYQLDSLFRLQQTDTMYEELQTLIPIDESAPDTYKLALYVHLVKSHRFSNEFEKSQLYLKKAEQIFETLDAQFTDPYSLIQLANLKLYSNTIAKKKGDFDSSKQIIQQARVILERIRDTFINHFDPHFNKELYGNLGHIYIQSHMLKRALNAYGTALFWAQQLDNQQQISVGYYNLARTYQKLQNYDKSRTQFKLALKYSELANDEQVAVQSLIRLFEIAHQTGNKQEGENMMSKLNAKKLSPRNINLLNVVKTELNLSSAN